MFRYERHNQPLIEPSVFFRRVAIHGGTAGTIIAGSLVAGSMGYHYTEGMSWLDALLNASMILTGMGPVSELKTSSGKLFASCFALYSGIVFLVVTSIVLAPFIHRLLHRLHLDADRDK